MDREDRRDALREEVTAADDTGMIAGEEFVALHAALPPDHPGHGTIDALHAEIHSASPDRGKIEEHVGRLRGIPELEATVVSWWERPGVQRFVDDLGRIGL
ncbi:MAG TPA: hypothetical protein VIW73_11160 [Candidatus Cybelea sp.]